MQLWIEKALSKLTWFEAAISIAAYALVAGLLLADIIGREFFSTSIYGAQKIAVQATMIAAFMGLSLATSQGSHMRAEAADALVPKRWSAQADRFGHVISAVLYAALAWISFTYMMETRQFGMRIPVLGWQMWPVQLVLPAAFGSSALKSLAFAVFPALAPHRQIETPEE
jgi:TRAP-type C4-dicarboxylate transport system permease small subunit